MKKNQTSTSQSFGEYFRSKRLALNLTLRTFCERYGYDPGNISRLERDTLPPSLDADKLAGYASALKIKKDSEDWVFFHDLAYANKGQIPRDIKENREATSFLPAFFRTMRNKKISKNKLERLIKLLNK